jgi:hypothetical protein
MVYINEIQANVIPVKRGEEKAHFATMTHCNGAISIFVSGN